MSAARSLASLQKDITGTVRYKDVPFTFTIIPNPHKKSEAEKARLANIFGNRIQKGTRCLDITEEEVLKNIENRNYTALIYVKNDEIDDSATGAIQYWNWCDKNSSNKQLWINDLCRVNNSGISSSDIVSPILILFDAIKDFSISKLINTNYLMVETGKPGTAKLVEIYEKYGFRRDDSCILEDSIAMKKNLSSSGGRRNNRRTRKKY
jgi:hypothetical protein